MSRAPRVSSLPPSPSEIDAQARAIAARLQELSTEYRLLHSLAYGPSGGGFGEARGTGHSDPTERLALHDPRRRRLRAPLSRIREFMGDIESSIAAARTSLRKAIEPRGFPGGIKDTTRYPATADRQAIREARAAQRRRQERGDE